jgi:hypothetical protein
MFPHFLDGFPTPLVENSSMGLIMRFDRPKLFGGCLKSESAWPQTAD